MPIIHDLTLRCVEHELPGPRAEFQDLGLSTPSRTTQSPHACPVRPLPGARKLPRRYKDIPVTPKVSELRQKRLFLTENRRYAPQISRRTQYINDRGRAKITTSHRLHSPPAN